MAKEQKAEYAETEELGKILEKALAGKKFKLIDLLRTLAEELSEEKRKLQRLAKMDYNHPKRKP